MISVGLVMGSPSAVILGEAIKSLMRFMELNRPTGGPVVELLFRLPGFAAPARFYGVEINGLDSNGRVLQVEIGVEEEWLTEAHPRATRYVYDVADEAVGTAARWLADRNIAYDLDSARGLLDAWFGVATT